MADDASSSHPSDRRDGAGRGGRGGAPRGEGGRGEASRGDAGGFRIRLSDNEMQAARALQEAFGLRSTVAVLGFSLRSLAQLLEQGQLEELIRQQRVQAGSRGTAPARGGERRGGRPDPGAGAARVKADPFARPSRPAAAPADELSADGSPVAEAEATDEAPPANDLVDEELVSDGSEPEPADAADAASADALSSNQV